MRLLTSIAPVPDYFNAKITKLLAFQLAFLTFLTVVYFLVTGFLLLLVLIFLSSAVCGGKKEKCIKKVKELEIKVTELEETIEEMKENQTKGEKRKF